MCGTDIIKKSIKIIHFDYQTDGHVHPDLVQHLDSL